MAPRTMGDVRRAQELIQRQTEEFERQQREAMERASRADTEIAVRDKEAEVHIRTLDLRLEALSQLKARVAAGDSETALAVLSAGCRR